MPVIRIDSVNSTAIMFSWMLATDGVSPSGFMLYYAGDGITPVNEIIGSAVRQYSVSNFQPGVTLSISLVALSEYLPSEAATISVVLEFQCKLSIAAVCIELISVYRYNMYVVTLFWSLSVAVRIADPGVLTVGQPATLTCSSDFSSDKISSIQWLNAGSVVEEDVASMQRFLILTIDPTTDNLTNTTYTCEVADTNSTVFMHNIVLAVKGELLASKFNVEF